MVVARLRCGGHKRLVLTAGLFSLAYFVLLLLVAAQAADSSPRGKPATTSNDFGVPQVRLINEAIERGWSNHQLVPSKAATDGEWCRRVYLDLLGRIPTVEELNDYANSRKRDKQVRRQAAPTSKGHDG